MKRLIVLFFPFVVVIIILTLSHVMVANMLSTTGVELDKLQTDLTKYKKENIFLHEKFLADTSLNHIASAAAEMGFVDALTNVYLPAELPLTNR